MVLLRESRRSLCLVSRLTRWLPALLLILVCQQIAVGQSDDFNDGDDNGWVRYDPFGTAKFSFPTNGNFGGKAYRIQSAASPNASRRPGTLLGVAHQSLWRFLRRS